MHAEIYYPYLIWETKKRYIGRKYEDGPDVEPVISASGVELTRRDNAALLRKAYQDVLSTIMPLDQDPPPASQMREKVANKLREVVWRVVDDDIPIEDYVISKSLRSTYKAPLAHSRLADKIRDRIARGEMVRAPPKAGDRIPFVVVKGREEKILDRAEDPEFAAEHAVPLDRLYYLEKQLETPLTVLCKYFCDASTIFDAAKAELWRRESNTADIRTLFSAATDSSSAAAPVAAAAAAPPPRVAQPPGPPQRTLAGGLAPPRGKRKMAPKPCSSARKRLEQKKLAF